jgi:hypothetical protein
MPSCCGILFSKFAKSEFLFVRNGGTLFEVVAVADSSIPVKKMPLSRETVMRGVGWTGRMVLLLRMFPAPPIPDLT